MLRIFSRPTHKDSDGLKYVYWHRSDKCQTPLRIFRRHWRRYFFACLIRSSKCFIEGEKEVLEEHFDRRNTIITAEAFKDLIPELRF